MSVYLIIQYVFIVGITSYFMFFGKPVITEGVDQQTVIRTIYIAALIILSITSIGFLLESKKFSRYIEFFRLICFGAVGALFLGEGYGLYAVLISTGICLGSSIHFSILVFSKPHPVKVEA
jgi:hypothetical protein